MKVSIDNVVRGSEPIDFDLWDMVDVPVYISDQGHPTDEADSFANQALNAHVSDVRLYNSILPVFCSTASLKTVVYFILESVFIFRNDVLPKIAVAQIGTVQILC